MNTSAVLFGTFGLLVQAFVLYSVVAEGNPTLSVVTRLVAVAF